MLDDFKEKQNVVYEVLMNQINNNHLSHAYLIDINNCTYADDFVMAFVKEVMCLNKNYDERQAICKRIDDDNYPEIKIIKPDGMLIKKQQILDLQKDFSMSAVEGSKRIYIIHNADMMRSETANSMLKFLEEPNNDIIAILMTNNYNNLLSTIISRCQIIRLINVDNISSDDDELMLIAINFIKSIENGGIITITREQELLFSKISIKERDKLSIFMDKLLDLYYDIMKINIGIFNIRNNLYFEDLKLIAGLNDIKTLIDKMNVLVKYKDSIKSNVNVNLLIDSLIISIGGIK